jgi:hypothetical protein
MRTLRDTTIQYDVCELRRTSLLRACVNAPSRDCLKSPRSTEARSLELLKPRVSDPSDVRIPAEFTVDVLLEPLFRRFLEGVFSEIGSLVLGSLALPLPA